MLLPFSGIFIVCFPYVAIQTFFMFVQYIFTGETLQTIHAKMLSMFMSCFIRHKLVKVFDKYIVIHKCFFSCKIFSYRHLPMYLSPIHVSFLHQLAYPSLILHFHRLSVKGLSHLCIILLINRLGMVSFFIPKYININILSFSFLVYCFTDTRNSIPEQSNFCAYRLLLSSIL